VPIALLSSLLEFVKEVRTPEGVFYYQAPMGTPITPEMEDEAEARAEARAHQTAHNTASATAKRTIAEDELKRKSAEELIAAHSHQELLDARQAMQAKYERGHPLVKKIRGAVVKSRAAGGMARQVEPEPAEPQPNSVMSQLYGEYLKAVNDDANRAAEAESQKIPEPAAPNPPTPAMEQYGPKVPTPVSPLEGDAALDHVDQRTLDVETKLSDKESAVLDYYNSVYGYQNINGRARGLVPPKVAFGHDYAQENIDALDSAFTKIAPLEQPIKVYRGFSDTRNLDIGDSFSDKGFVSTTTDADVAKRYAEGQLGGTDEDQPAVARITVPAGTKAISTEPFKKNDTERTMNEVLLPRNTQFRVVDDSVDANGMRQLDLEVVPKAAPTPAEPTLHEKLVQEALAGHTAQEHPIATFLGGGPASGKSTMMNKPGEDTVNVAADEIKPKLPGYKEHGAAAVHAESSAVASEIQHQAIEHRYNFTLDGTGNSTYAKMERRVQAAKQSGYTTEAKYITVDTDEAVHREALRRAETGRGVPETVVREKHAAVSDIFKQAIDNDLFDQAELWDNNGTEPTLIGRKELGGKWTVSDQAAWQRFLDKRAPLEGDDLLATDSGSVTNVSRAEQAAAAAWYEESYEDINEHLREGSPLVETLPDTIPLLKQLIARSTPFTRDALTYRGIVSPDEVFGPVGSKVGETFVDHGFVSVAPDDESVGEFGATEPAETGALIAVRIPRGTRALKSSSLPEATSSKEYTLAPDTTFKIADDTVVDGKRKVQLEVVPRRPIAFRGNMLLDREDATRELDEERDRQSKLIPEIVNSAKVTVAPQGTTQGRSRNAVRDIGGDIEIDPELLGRKRATTQFGWHSAFGSGTTSAQRSLAHEFGHGVHYAAAQQENRRRSREFPVSLKLWGAFAKALGVAPPSAATSEAVIAWFNANQHGLERLVSRYGITNPKELLADLWVTYSTGGKGALAAIYGEYVKGLLK
jgi:predicted ABC-type ATPase